MIETVSITALAAERSILGGVISSHETHQAALDMLAPTDFGDPRNGTIFASIKALHDRQDPIDAITVLSELGERGGGLVSGWSALIAEIMDSEITPANIEHHVEVVRKDARRRDFVRVMTEALQQANRPGANADEIFTKVSLDLGTIAEGRALVRPQTMDELVRQEFKDMEARDETGDAVGLPSGFPELDHRLCGLVGGNLIIAAGRPSMGKSSFVRNILAHLAIRESKAGLLFSLEMRNTEIVKTMMAAEALVSLQRVRTGKLVDHEWPMMANATGRLHTNRIALVDKPDMSVAEVRSIARQHAAKHPLDAVAVDYLQLMRGEGQSRQEEVASISRGLKALAMELDVPVIALSQLNRSVESRADKRPMLSDLRESGSIEQDADVVMLIYRDEYYNTQTEEPGTAEIAIAKNRNGPTGMIKLPWSGQHTRFGQPESQHTPTGEKDTEI